MFTIVSRHPTAETLQFGKMNRILNIHKSSLYPNAPLTAAAVMSAFENAFVRDKYGKSLDTENPFDFYNGTVIEEQYQFAVFSSAKMIEKAKKMQVRNYHVDATFGVVPNGKFKQLLIVHIAHEEHAFPLVYVLMTNKSEEAYTHVFRYIEENVFHMAPTSFMSDFERGMRNAFRTVYPGCIIYGCWFHYCQAIRRKSTQMPGFAKFLKGNVDAKKLFHKFMALPLLRLDLIPNGVKHLKDEAATFGLAFAGFVKYFERFWMRIETPASFCVFMKVSRTNNLVESHNSKLRRKIEPNGNFYKFIEVFQKEELIKNFEMGQVVDGALDVYSKQRNKMKTRNKNLKALQNKLNDNELGIEAFLTQVSYIGNGLMQDFVSNLPDEVQPPPINEDDDDDDFIASDSDPEPESEAETAVPVNVDRLLEEATSELNCIICVDKRKSQLLLPCAHLALCDDCVTILLQTPPLICPLCRTVVKSLVKVSGH